MDSIELSFCIPTYNRAQIVRRLVTDILMCSDPNIEVVVLDNGSTDDTLNILRAIKDDRLVVYSNGENKGALFNMINVLNKGRGKFLVYSTDQDHIDSNKIKQFKSFLLQHPDLAGGYCEFNSSSELQFEIFPKGYQSITKISYKGRHPTGYFFNNNFLKSVNLVERFSDYEFVDLFPLDFAFAELCLMGNGAIYHGSIFSPETGTMVVNHKSSTTNGKSNKAFFSPEARLKLAVNYTKHINTLQLSSRERDLLTSDVFIHGLISATFGYRSVLRNKKLCIHYYMECRDINIKELFSIGLNFYTHYLRKSNDLLGSSFFNRTKFSTNIISSLCRKIVGRGCKLFISKWQERQKNCPHEIS